MANTNYYTTLGLVQGAEQAVISAAYRALVKLFHPDKNPDPEAAERMAAINEAYEVLSDPKRRADYDASIGATSGAAQSSDFDPTPSFDSNPLQADWEIALEFHPHLEKWRSHVEEISWALAFAFQLKILEERTFFEDVARETARRMIRVYLQSFFGSDPAILNLAERAIRLRFMDIALFINRSVRVLGKTASAAAIVRKIEQNFPGELQKLKIMEIRNQAQATGELSYSEAVSICAYLGFKVERVEFATFWARVTIKNAEQTKKFKNDREFRHFVYESLLHAEPGDALDW